MQQQRLQRQNNELLAFKSASSQRLSHREMPELIRNALEKESILRAIGVAAQGDFNYYSELQSVSEARAMQSAGLAAIISELQLSADTVQEVNDAIIAHRRLLEARKEVKLEIKQLQDQCGRIQVGAQHAALLLLLKRRRDRAVAVKYVCECVLKLNNLLQEYDGFFCRGPDYLGALRRKGVEFDTLVAQNQWLRRLGVAEQILSQKNVIFKESQLLSASEFITLFVEQAKSQCEVLRIRAGRSASLDFDFEIVDFLALKFGQIQPSHDVFITIAQRIAENLEKTIQVLLYSRQKFVFANGVVLFLEQLAQRVGFPEDEILAVLQILITGLKRHFLQLESIEDPVEMLQNATDILETRFGKSFQQGEIRFLYLKMLQSLAKHLSDSNPHLLISQTAAAQLIKEEKFQRMGVKDPVRDLSCSDITIEENEGILTAQIRLGNGSYSRPFAISAVCLKIALALVGRRTLVEKISVPLEYREQLEALLSDSAVLSLYFSFVKKMLRSPQLREATALECLQFLLKITTIVKLPEPIVHSFQASLTALEPEIVQHAIEKVQRATAECVKEFCQLVDQHQISTEETTSKELTEQLITPLAQVQQLASDAIRLFQDKLGQEETEEFHSTLEVLFVNTLNQIIQDFLTGPHKGKKGKKATPQQRAFLIAFSIRKFLEFVISQGVGFQIQFKPDFLRQNTIDDIASTLGTETYILDLSSKQSTPTSKSFTQSLSIVKGLFNQENQNFARKIGIDQ